MSFKSKVVIITGAATGIGAAIALNFAKEHASLCITDMNERDLFKTKKECEEVNDSKVTEIVADISKDEDVNRIVDEALKQFNRIDVVINCAGIFGDGSLNDEDIIEKFDKVLSVNLRPVVVMTKVVLPALIESQGCIVNISSVTTLKVISNLLPYSISKAGVSNFTKGSAFELAKHGVRVNCISPGPVETNIMMNGGMTEEDQINVWNGIVNKTALKKLIMPGEIADLVVYLASDKAASITGSDFLIDAGVMLGNLEVNPDCRVQPRNMD